MIVTFSKESRPDLYEIYYRELVFHSKLKARKLSNNYQIHNMSIDDQLVFSIGYQYDVDDPFGLSSVYRRDSWPLGVYRILNRTWKPLGELDDGVTLKLDQIWIDMIDDQIRWLRCNVPDYKAAIISREHDSRKFLQHLIKKLDASSTNKFTLCDSRIWLCENKNNPNGCYQDVLYTGESEVIETWSKYED